MSAYLDNRTWPIITDRQATPLLRCSRGVIILMLNQ